MALVRYGNDAWELHPDGTLTFGRGTDCDIRLPEAGSGSAEAAAEHLFTILQLDPAQRPADVLAWSRTLAELAMPVSREPVGREPVGREPFSRNP